MAAPSPQKVRWVLACGVLSLSFAAILVRYADAGPLATAFWRKGLAAMILLGVVLGRGRTEPFKWSVHRRLLPYTLGTGLLLAFHFGAWFASLKLIPVASSLLLIATQPVWAALLGWLFLGDKVTLRGMAGIVLAIGGIAFIASGDLGRFGNLWGDFLSLAAAIAASAYLTVGRRLKDSIPLAQYLLVVYAVAAGTLCCASLATGQSLGGYDARTWLMLALMAIFPSTLGHNLINYAVRHMAAYRVSLTILIEPVVSTILAAILLSEVPPPIFYAGALLVFAGVVLALWEDEAPTGLTN